MLYSLRASYTVREQLSKAVAEANIATCISLFRGISNGREIAERCAAIVDRLGKATLTLFDSPLSSDQAIDTEFLSWFGLKSQALPTSRNNVADQIEHWPDDAFFLTDSPNVPSVDGAWRDLFAQGYNWEAS